MNRNNIPATIFNQAFSKENIDKMKEQIKEMKEK